VSGYRPDRTYFKRSLAASAGLHFLLLPLLIAAVPAMLGFEWIAATSNSTDRDATSISYLTIEHRAAKVRSVVAHHAPAHRSVARNSALAARGPLQSLAPRHRAAAALASRASEPLNAGARAHSATESASTVALVRSAAAARSGIAPRNQPPSEAERPVAPQALSAVPSPSPSPSPQAAADSGSVRIVDVPAGGWGQNFEQPIVADDGQLADLRARYHEAARASIEVDDAGHATHVTLPTGMTDDQRTDLERRLMALRYIPAECNGLHCSGTLILTL